MSSFGNLEIAFLYASFKTIQNPVSGLRFCDSNTMKNCGDGIRTKYPCLLGNSEKRTVNNGENLTILRRNMMRLPRKMPNFRRNTGMLPGRLAMLPKNMVMLPGNMTMLPGNMLMLPGNVVNFRGNMVVLPGNVVNFPRNMIRLQGNKHRFPRTEGRTQPGQ